MSMASGWVMNCLGSAPVGSAGFASATGAGAGGSSFFPHPARNVVDAAILVIATKRCRCMVALSLDGRVRGRKIAWGQPPFPCIEVQQAKQGGLGGPWQD